MPTLTRDTCRHGRPECRCSQNQRIQREAAAQATTAVAPASSGEAPPPDAVLFAVDPGDTHVGLAIFKRNVRKQYGWECIHVQEMEPGVFLAFLQTQYEEMPERFRYLVVENFRLYPWKSEEQAWSEMLTCQLIGAIKALHALHGGQIGWWGDRLRMKEVEMALQGADIKGPAIKQVKARKIPAQWKAQGVSGQHVKDAELHGWYYILTTLQ